jgi:hypothetical protein
MQEYEERSMTRLVLTVLKKYFDQIKSGEKTVEYRLYKSYWISRIENKHFDEIEIRWGRPTRDALKNGLADILWFPWKGYAIETIMHEHFGSEPVKVFAIKLERLK